MVRRFGQDTTEMGIHSRNEDIIQKSLLLNFTIAFQKRQTTRWCSCFQITEGIKIVSSHQNRDGRQKSGHDSCQRDKRENYISDYLTFYLFCFIFQTCTRWGEWVVIQQVEFPMFSGEESSFLESKRTFWLCYPVNYDCAVDSSFNWDTLLIPTSLDELLIIRMFSRLMNTHELTNTPYE